MALPKLYTVREVCEALGVSRTTLHRLTKSRQIYAYKVGKALRYPGPAVEAYLEGRAYGPADDGPAATRPDLSTWPPTESLLNEE